MLRAETATVLRAWSDRPDACVSEFSPAEQEAALRVVDAVRAVFADRVASERGNFVEGLREVGEPSVHVALFTRGSTHAERIVRGGA